MKSVRTVISQMAAVSAVLQHIKKVLKGYFDE
jgi:hypothetical protein